LVFHESIFEFSDFEVSVFGKMAFLGLGNPEKGFWKIEFHKLTGYRFEAKVPPVIKDT